MTSINLTIFNKENMLWNVLERIDRYTTGDYELVCVLDSCTDRSAQILYSFKNQRTHIPIRVFEDHELYETKANNLAATQSTGDYIIIVQDDMLINEPDWNVRLIKPMQAFDDVFAVTARTTHNWIVNDKSKHISIHPPDGSWSDILIHTDHAHKGNTPRNQFAIRECVNRGPLAIRHDVFEELGYFDEQFSPQDMDDHDLCYRARDKGFVCGCYWIDFISDDAWGSTRENGAPRQWLLDSNWKNSKIVLERHRQRLEGPKLIEQRILS